MRKNPCPVNLRVWDMDGTDRCLMCFNCMRVCPLDNVALFGRKPLASLWKESYPRFSDAVLAASLMGFILLTFSRFWPPVQGLITLPVKWLGPYIGTASRPLFLVWLGIGLPLLTVLISAAFVAWGRTNSAVAVFSGDIIPEKVPPGGPGARKGLTMAGLPVKVWLEEAHSQPAGDPSGEEKIMGVPIR
jgi:ferredoxin